MVNSFDLCASNTTGPTPFFGWPILPHGGGASWNALGTYIGGVAFSPDPQVSENQSFGEYFPCTDAKGEILGVAANITNLSGRPYGLYAVNYGPGNYGIPPSPPIAGVQYQWELVDILPALSTGQVCWSVAPGDGVPLVNGAAGTFGDSFGLAVAGPEVNEPSVGKNTPPPEIIVEGTIYFSITLPVP